MKKSVKEKVRERKSKYLIISMLFMSLILFIMLFGKETEAAERYGEFYEVQGNYITRILPQTTVQDLKNNIEIQDIQVKTETGETVEDNEYVGTGMNLIAGGKTYTLSVIGDLDGNGRITITDLAKMKLHTGKINVLDGAYGISADINGDNKTTITDLSQMMLVLVNIKDIIAPEGFEPKITTGKNVITVSASAVDANSGIGEYFFKLDNGEWMQNQEKANGRYTFSGVDLSVSHKVTVKVQDKAGNAKKTAEVFVEEQAGSINIYANTTEWTNKDVLITVEYDINLLNTRRMISIDNGVTFEEYEEPVVVDRNTTIIAQIRNSQNEVLEEARYEVTNIDKLAPIEFEPDLVIGRKDVTINVATEDASATARYGKSGIKEYEYVIKVGLWKWKITTSETTYVFNTLTPEEVYAVEVIAKDYAGNEIKVVKENISLKSDYTLRFNANGGTVEPESITAEVGSIIELPIPERKYTISYETNGGEVIEADEIESEFQGWYTSLMGGEKVTYRTMPELEEDSETLYAQWRTPYAFLPTPTREKYRFLGWYENENFEGIGISGGESFTPTKDVTYYAKWELAEFNLTFEYNGATAENAELTRKVTLDNAYGELPQPERIYTLTYKSNDGREDVTETKEYEFQGWYKEATFENEITANSIVTTAGDHTIYAKWNEYEVEISSPEERTGYAFNGWYENSLFEGEKYDAGDKLILQKDMTFYAKWTGENFGVNYEYNGATAGNLELGKDVTYGSKYGELPTPTRVYTVTLNKNNGTENEERNIAYTFGGWCKEATLETIVDANTIVETAEAHNIYAKWTSASTTLPTLEREGYIFGGWYENSTFTSTNAYEGETAYTPTGDITFYAKWSLIDYTIIYDLDGGAVATENPTSYNIETNTFTLNKPTKEGYTFEGWTGTGLDEATLEVTIEKGSIGNRTYVAHWTANTDTAYTVIHKRMDVNGEYPTEENSELIEIEDKTGTTGESITPGVKTYEGFTAPETQTTIIAANGSTEITYLYERNKYQFTLGTGTGVNTEGSTATGEYYHGATITLALAVTEGYENPTWTSSNTALVPSPTTLNTTFTMPKGTITMTPSVTAKEYTITYDLDDGEATNPNTYTIETESFTLNRPTKTGYTFAGWTGTGLEEATLDVTIEKESTGNRTYTAQWTANTDTRYTVIHKRMDVNGNYPTEENDELIETEDKTGTTGESITPGVKTYEGFTAPETQTTTIAGNGNTEITYLYERNKYEFALGTGTGVDTTGSTATGEYYHGATITLALAATEGYENPTWTSSNTTLVASPTTANTTFTMPIGAITMTPSATESIVSGIFATLYDTNNDGKGDKLVYTANSRTLTSYGTKIEQYNLTNGITGNSSSIPWYSQRENITSAKIEDIIQPTSAKYLFGFLSNITSIDNIEKLDTSNVTDMSYMFDRCSSLTSLDVSNFDTSNVTSMEGMFFYCNRLAEIDVSNFNTSNVTDMCCMFYNCSSLASLNVSNFDTSNVVYFGRKMSQSILAGMFHGCSNLTELNLSSFDTRNATDMTYMFKECSNLESITFGSNFNTSNVTEMYSMFESCSSLLELNLSNFDTSNVTDMCCMFDKCSSLTELDLGSFNIENVTNYDYIFNGCTNLTTIYGNTTWQKVNETPNRAFDNCGTDHVITNSVYVKLYDTDGDGNGDTLTLASVPNMFLDGNSENVVNDYNNKNFAFTTFTINNLPPWHEDKDTINSVQILDEIYPTSTAYWFNDMRIDSLDVGNINTENVVDMTAMFYNCWNLISLDLSSFDTSNVGNTTAKNRIKKPYTSDNTVYEINAGMTEMFSRCTYLENLNLSSFNTSNVTDMSFMFFGCRDLRRLDLSSFDTSNVTNMEGMINSCTFLTNLNISSFDTSNVTNMLAMFAGSSNISELNLSHFNTSNVTNMREMFFLCSKLTSLDLSNFDITKVTNYTEIFLSCRNLTAIYGNTTWRKVNETPIDAFDNCGTDHVIINSVYATLYDTDSDGTGDKLVFTTDNRTITEYGEQKEQYDVTNTSTCNVFNSNTKKNITSVDIVDKIYPKSTYYWFDTFTNLTQIEHIENLKTNRVTNMERMFFECSSLTSLNLSNFDTRNVTDMGAMFWGCSSLTSLNLSNFDTRNVTDMQCMFVDCSGLTSIDLSSFDTSNVTTMRWMFLNCSRVAILDLSSFDTSNVTSMEEMFSDCLALTQIKVKSGKWQTSQANTTKMFFRAGVSEVTYC